TVVAGPGTTAGDQLGSSRIAYGHGSATSNGAVGPATVPSMCTTSARSAAVAAIGGRLGPRRATASRENNTRTGRLIRSASARAAAMTGDATLPPNAPPFASGDAGSPPGAHHDASGSRYAGSTQLVVSRTPPGGSGGSGNGDESPTVVRRPCTLP